MRKRALQEEEALRAAAVAAYGRPVEQGSRKSGQVRIYYYAEPMENGSHEPTGPIMREPHPYAPIVEAIGEEESRMLDALIQFQLQCGHGMTEDVAGRKTLHNEAISSYVSCSRCGAILRWWGSYTATLRAEWMSFRPAEFPPDQWGELFTKDKTSWLPLIEEAAFALEEEANGT